MIIFYEVFTCPGGLGSLAPPPFIRPFLNLLSWVSYWGRRRTLVVFMLIGGIACLIIQAVGGMFIFFTS